MKCFNWKVVAGLAAAALGLYLVAPGTMAPLLPFLVFAICPLSMLVMMRAMSSGSGSRSCDTASDDAQVAELRAEVAALRAERNPAIGDR